MAETFRDVLNHIQSFLESDGILSSEKYKLWDVLSALRGPDSGTDTLKNSTTAVIRRHALGNSLGYVGATTNTDDDTYAANRANVGYRYDHFHSHVLNAFSALDLDYFENNDKKRNDQ